ncbi:MAG: sigma-70 family RNA polymerase sigma factor [Planctomycetes bacterium]|nr:sigma-70 family RNA polymerase sigma factor [Planctomycetota bacterium]
MDPAAENLVPGLARGDEDAWRRLVRSHGEPLLRYAAGMTGDVDSAQDIVQSAFARLFRHRRNLRNETLRALCYSTTGNLARDYLRRRKLRNRPPEPSVNPDPSPEQQAIAREAWTAALSLPEELREIVVLHFGHGLSLAEVGEVVGSPKGTVSTRLRRALDELRERLKYSAALVALPSPDALGDVLAGNAALCCTAQVSPFIVQHLELIVMATIGKQGVGTLALWLIVLLVAGGGLVIWVTPFATPEDRTSSRQIANVADDSGAGESLANERGQGAETTPPTNNKAAVEVPKPHSPVAGTPTSTPGVRIFGRVMDHRGGPVPQTKVWLDWSRGDGQANARPETTTDSDGLYSFHLTAPSKTDEQEVRLFCGVSALHPSEIMGSVTGVLYVNFSRFSEHRLDVTVLPAIGLAFRVMDTGGSPVSGARIWWPDGGIPGTMPHGEVFEVTTGADGWATTRVPQLENSYSFLEFPVVIVQAARFSAQEYRLEFQPDGLQEFIITLRDATRFEGLLVNSQGEPIRSQGFELELDPERYENRPVIVECLLNALRTDEAGRFAIESFPVGTLQAVARAEGYHDAEGLTLVASEPATIRLLRKSSTVLEVQDRDGNPIMVSSYDVCRLAADGSVVFKHGHGGIVKPQLQLGRFLPGTYRIDARPAGWSSSASIQIEITEEDTLHEWRIAPPVGTCTLAGRVTNSAGVGVMAQAVMLTMDGKQVAVALSSTEDGTFSFGSVEPGRYQLQLASTGLATKVLDVTLPNHETLEVSLDATATLILRLPAGDPPYTDRWEAIVLDGQGRRNSAQRWHNEVPGTYRLEHLTSGEITVTIVSSQFTLWKVFEGDRWQRKIKVAPGETAEMQIDDLPRHRVCLRLLTADRQPLAHAMLDLKRVSLTEPDPGVYHGTYPHVMTDGAGEFRTTWLLPGRYFFNGPRDTRVFFEVEDRDEQTIEVRVATPSPD